MKGIIDSSKGGDLPAIPNTYTSGGWRPQENMSKNRDLQEMGSEKHTNRDILAQCDWAVTSRPPAKSRTYKPGTSLAVLGGASRRCRGVGVAPDIRALDGSESRRPTPQRQPLARHLTSAPVGAALGQATAASVTRRLAGPWHQVGSPPGAAR